MSSCVAPASVTTMPADSIVTDTADDEQTDQCRQHEQQQLQQQHGDVHVADDNPQITSDAKDQFADAPGKLPLQRASQFCYYIGR